MGLAKLKTKIGIEDYLDGEEFSQTRHEYINGEVYAMAGASDRHYRICMNIASKIDAHLAQSRCEAFMAEMKLRADENTFYYPDVFVSCDEVKPSAFYREQAVLVVEVVSPSTRQTDRREKLRVYQQMPTVQEYVIIEQDKMHVEIHRRQPGGRWITYFYDHGDLDENFEFEAVNLPFTLEEIYNRVTFDA